MPFWSDPLGLDRTLYFFGHAWIFVDTYGEDGEKNGKLMLDLAPSGDPSQPDWRIYATDNNAYPERICFTIKSTKTEDEELLKHYENMAKTNDPSERWTYINNCIVNVLNNQGVGMRKQGPNAWPPPVPPSKAYIAR